MKKFLIFIVIIGIAGVAVYFGFNGKDFAQVSGPVEPGSETSGTLDSGEAAAGSSTAWEPDPIFAEPVVYGQLKQSYSGSGFSFKYSDGFKVASNLSPAPSGIEGETVTVENQKGSGFQIFIIAFDEPGPITPERIWQDMPDMEINDPKNAQLDGVKTLVFNGYDEDMGETFEAWVVRKGKLYQISGPKTAEKLMIETLETWEWK